MTERNRQQCVVLPCTENDLWAVPENSLAEIVTLAAECDTPPEELEWRGQRIPVLDLQSGGEHWGSRHGGTGLVAVLRGLDQAGPAYWGVCLREHGLRVENIPDEPDDAVEDAAEYALGAFRHEGALFQVPDLVAMQQRAAAQ
jgi:hypothetical protein